MTRRVGGLSLAGLVVRVREAARVFFVWLGTCIEDRAESLAGRV